MRIPVRVTLFDVGVGGAPTTTNPHALARLDAVEFVSVNEGGYESLEVRFRAPTRQAARQYLARLMANVHVDGPRGKRCWEGFVQEVAVTIDGMTTTKSMVDLANMVVVRYKSETGAQASASALTNTASIARYGTKCRLINYSTTTPAVASNRAATALAQSASPGEKRTRASGSGTPEPGYAVVITCRGWWDTLGWLLTSSASTASVATSTQALNLITAYNAVNPFFSTSTARVTATGLNDTSVIEDDSTYAEAIATKLASGNAAQQRVVYGCYQDRQITIRPWAKANPTTYAYQQRAGDPTIRDGYGNVIDTWDVQPDAMVLLDGVDAQYIRRVRVKLSRDAQTLELEADESEGVEELLTKPAGAGPSGTSARQAAIERTVHRQAQTRFSGTNGKVDMGGGRLSTGGGSILTGGGDIDTGGGSIDLGGGTIDTGGGSILTGGGTITYPPGGGTGATGSGTTGKLTKWSDGPAGVLADAAVSMAGAGSLVLQPEVAANLTLWGNLTAWSAGEIDLHGSYFGLNSSMTISPAGATTGQALAYNGTVWAPATIGALGGAPIGAKYIVQQSDGTLTNEQALGSLSTGLLKNTTTTGVLSIAVAGTDYVAPSSLNELIDDRVAALLVAGTGISLSYNDAGDSLTISTSGLGEIIDDQVAGLLVAGNLISLSYNDAAGTLTIAVNSLNETIDDRVAALLVAGTGISLSYNDAAGTLTISNTGGTVGGTGTAGRLMQWASGGADAENSTLIKGGAGVLTLSAAGAYTLTVPASGTAVLGTGANQRVSFWTGTNTLSSDANLLYDASANVLVITGGMAIGPGMGSGSGSANGECIIGGSAAAFSFVERGGSNTWSWYATSSKARLFDGTTDRLIIATGGNTGIKVTPTHTLHLGDDDAAKTTTTTWTTTSDARTKTILHDYTPGLALLRALPPVRVFERNGRFGTQAGEIGVGYIAQELEAVVPTWVRHSQYEDPDGSTAEVLRVNQHELSYVLANAIRELADRLDRAGIV